MPPHDIPPLIPKPPEKDWADYNTNPDPDNQTAPPPQPITI
ncbi:hypothetical protein ACXIUA_09525 [Corynebacterium sp. UMB8791]